MCGYCVTTQRRYSRVWFAFGLKDKRSKINGHLVNGSVILISQCIFFLLHSFGNQRRRSERRAVVNVLSKHISNRIEKLICWNYSKADQKTIGFDRRISTVQYILLLSIPHHHFRPTILCIVMFGSYVLMYINIFDTPLTHVIIIVLHSAHTHSLTHTQNIMALKIMDLNLC